MAGFNQAEGTLGVRLSYPEYTNSQTGPHINRSTFESLVRGALLGQDKHRLIRDAVHHQYTSGLKFVDADANFLDAYVDFFGDYMFRSGSDATLQSYFRNGVANLYQYYFTHVPSSSLYREGPVNPSWLGAGHSEEFQFIFGWSFNDDIMKHKHELSDEEKVLSLQMMKMWSNFAKSGDPTREFANAQADSQLPAWPRFTIPEFQYLNVALNPKTENAVRASACEFWNKYIPSLRKILENNPDVSKIIPDDGTFRRDEKHSTHRSHTEL